MDPLKYAALRWFRAEMESDPSAPHRIHVADPNRLTISDIYTLAVPRVRKVFEGEVRWSEASPGDRAIWKGRPRDIERAKHRGPTGIYQSYWHVAYDTIVLSVASIPNWSYRLFGNRNVGNLALSNQQIPGQMGGEDAFVVDQVYASVNRDLTTEDQVSLSFEIGCHALGYLPIREWLLGVPIGQVVPPRQNFSAVVMAHREIVTPLEIVVCLEGTIRYYEQ